MKRTFTVVMALFVASIGATVQSKEISMSAEEAELAGPLVAAMLVAGRGVVARHQTTINDPDKGNKGFTPQYVAKLMLSDFEEIAGKGVDKIQARKAREAVQATLAASQQAVQNNQGRINVKGKDFKGFIPAVYGRITGNILKGRTGIEIKQTTFKFRNTYNEPDEFESKVLARFENDKPQMGYGERQGNRYRYMQPIYIKKACLSCHGEPKGELDIAGKPKEGYKIGDLRGAISVSIPVR